MLFNFLCNFSEKIMWLRIFYHYWISVNTPKKIFFLSSCSVWQYSESSYVHLLHIFNIGFNIKKFSYFVSFDVRLNEFNACTWRYCTGCANDALEIAKAHLIWNKDFMVPYSFPTKMSLLTFRYHKTCLLCKVFMKRIEFCRASHTHI